MTVKESLGKKFEFGSMAGSALLTVNERIPQKDPTP